MEDKDLDLMVELERLFFQSHRRFETRLLELKRNSSNWLEPVFALIQKPLADPKGFTVVLAANNFSNVALAEELIESAIGRMPGILNNTTVLKNSILHYAAFNGREKIVGFLVESGLPPAQQNARGNTALHLALENSHFVTVEKLISHLSPEEINVVNDQGASPIHTAIATGASTKVIQRLIDSGVAINKADRWGITPIQYSILRKQKEIEEILRRMILDETPDFIFTPAIPQDEIVNAVKGKEVPECWCLWCLIRSCVQSKVDGPCCTCLHHFQAYAKDSLSISNAYTLNICPCASCTRIQDDYKTRHSCGTPIDNEYLLINDSLKKSPRVVAPYTDPPILPSWESFDSNAIVPYPGHNYFDHLIDQRIEEFLSKYSEQNITMTTLDHLTSAGFKNWKSIRKNPNETLRWVISNFDRLSALYPIIGVLLDLGANVDTTQNKLALMDCVARKECVPILQLLLDYKPTVETLSYALLVSIQNNKNLSARMLLNAGASISYRYYRSEKSALHYAISAYEGSGSSIPLL